MTRHGLVAGLVVGILASSRPAPAQVRDPAGAERLYDEGTRLLDAGDWAGACTRFEQSQALDPAPGTLLNLASCAERDGKLATAWLRLREARSLNADTPTAARRAEIERFVEAALARLEPRVPQLTVRLDPPMPGATVTRGGAPTATGVSLPVDPGRHVVEVTVPGRPAVRREVALAEGAREEIVIAIPEPESAPPPPPPSPPATAPIGPDPAGGGLGSLQIAGLVVGGVGAATLGVSLVTGLVASGKEGDLEALRCESVGDVLRCDGRDVASAEDLSSSGATFATISTATTFAGAALLATGLVLLLVGDERPATQVGWHPVAAPGEAGVAWRGSF